MTLPIVTLIVLLGGPLKVDPREPPGLDARQHRRVVSALREDTGSSEIAGTQNAPASFLVASNDLADHAV